MPKSWKKLGYSSYYECVINEGKNFLDLLGKLDDFATDNEYKYIGKLSKNHLESVACCFYQAVYRTLQSYLNEGSPYLAYKTLNESLTNNNETAKRLSFYLEFATLYSQHYRIREKNSIADMKDLFHVPFELRNVINSNRYSIPGFPSLYFSNSIFLAYNELGCPDYDNLYVSKFLYSECFNEQETLLDMTNTSPDDSLESRFRFLARWVLNMACCVKVGDVNLPFKPEYVLPQLILQWVKNNIQIGTKKVIGVKYSSTKVSTNKDGFSGFFYNTAIPIRTSEKKGFCSVLEKQFCLTKPISFNEALKFDKITTQIGQVKSFLINGASVEYVHSDFGKIEKVLSEAPYSKLFFVNGKSFDK